MTNKNPVWDDKNFIWDEETKCWYINEFHLQQTKAALESNRRLQARLPLTHEEIVANIERIYSMGSQKGEGLNFTLPGNVSDSTTNIIGTGNFLEQAEGHTYSAKRCNIKAAPSIAGQTLSKLFQASGMTQLLRKTLP